MRTHIGIRFTLSKYINKKHTGKDKRENALLEVG